MLSTRKSLTNLAPTMGLMSEIRLSMFEFFHNSCPIRSIQENENLKKLTDLTRNLTQVACSTVSYSNHYTKVFSALM